MIELAKGQELTLTTEDGASLTTVQMAVGWDHSPTAGFIGSGAAPIDLDASAVQFAGGQFFDLAFFNNLATRDGSVVHLGDNTTGKGEGEKDPKAENGQGRLASAFPLVRLGANAAAARDPEKKPLLERKEQLEQAIDKLKYEKAAMQADEYKKQLTQLLLELAKVQEALEQ